MLKKKDMNPLPIMKYSAISCYWEVEMSCQLLFASIRMVDQVMMSPSLNNLLVYCGIKQKQDEIFVIL